jgi:aminoglycoside/choline kinase family phosphotransferase
MKILKEFSIKKKSEKDFGKIFIANSENEKEIMSVSAFVSRPVIHLRSKDGDSRLGVFNFSDALVRFSA